MVNILANIAYIYAPAGKVRQILFLPCFSQWRITPKKGFSVGSCTLFVQEVPENKAETRYFCCFFARSPNPNVTERFTNKPMNIMFLLLSRQPYTGRLNRFLTVRSSRTFAPDSSTPTTVVKLVFLLHRCRLKRFLYFYLFDWRTVYLSSCIVSWNYVFERFQFRKDICCMIEGKLIHLTHEWWNLITYIRVAESPPTILIRFRFRIFWNMKTLIKLLICSYILYKNQNKSVVIVN